MGALVAEELGVEVSDAHRFLGLHPALTHRCEGHGVAREDVDELVVVDMAVAAGSAVGRAAEAGRCGVSMQGSNPDRGEGTDGKVK